MRSAMLHLICDLGLPLRYVNIGIWLWYIMKHCGCMGCRARCAVLAFGFWHSFQDKSSRWLGTTCSIQSVRRGNSGPLYGPKVGADFVQNCTCRKLGTDVRNGLSCTSNRLYTAKTLKEQVLPGSNHDKTKDKYCSLRQTTSVTTYISDSNKAAGGSSQLSVTGKTQIETRKKTLGCHVFFFSWTLRTLRFWPSFSENGEDVEVWRWSGDRLSEPPHGEQVSLGVKLWHDLLVSPVIFA